MAISIVAISIVAISIVAISIVAISIVAWRSWRGRLHLKRAERATCL